MRLRERISDLWQDGLHWPSVGATLVVLAVAGAIGGLSVVLFGLYNVSARTGHLAPVYWALHATYRNAVELRAPPPSDAPDLRHPGLIELGARHYDAACRVCHAAPGEPRTATVRAMNPVPPHITEAVGTWDAGELWWIVHEGVKMSGMPGWASPRKEEVWPVVAFLRRVQERLDEGGYARLTRIPAEDPEGIGYCIGCHGRGGASSNPFVPRLDILSEPYLLLSLRAYRRGDRDSGIMEHAATEVDETALARFAAQFAGAGVADLPGVVWDPALAGRGRELAHEAASTRVPACVACHGPWEAPLDRLFPSLAGQHAPYLAAQLRLWRDGQRGGGPAAELMHEASRELTDADILALAAYYAALAPATLDETAE